MNILYFDCFSGISGDMVIGALIDAGGDSTHLVNELKKLTMEDEYELTFTKVVKNGITSTKFDVLLTNEEHSHQITITITITITVIVTVMIIHTIILIAMTIITINILTNMDTVIRIIIARINILFS